MASQDPKMEAEQEMDACNGADVAPLVEPAADAQSSRGAWRRGQLALGGVVLLGLLVGAALLCGQGGQSKGLAADTDALVNKEGILDRLNIPDNIKDKIKAHAEEKKEAVTENMEAAATGIPEGYDELIKSGAINAMPVKMGGPDPNPYDYLIGSVPPFYAGAPYTQMVTHYGNHITPTKCGTTICGKGATCCGAKIGLCCAGGTMCCWGMMCCAPGWWCSNARPLNGYRYKPLKTCGGGAQFRRLSDQVAYRRELRKMMNMDSTALADFLEASAAETAAYHKEIGLE